jgi:hypothetical protein
MLDLLKIKQNGDYDFIQSIVPTTNGTWLCSDDLSGYTKGYSYSISDDDISRIEVVEDYKIDSILLSTIQNTSNFLNNFFYVKRQTDDTLEYDNKYNSLSISDSKDLNRYVATYGNYTFNAGIVSGVQSNIFQIGDLVQLKCSLRNNYLSYVTNVSGNQITLDNEDMRNTTEDCLIMLMDIKKNVQDIIAQMIYYDVFIRENPDNLQSESIGNYSYSKATAKVGELYYPPELVSGLIKTVRFI